MAGRPGRVGGTWGESAGAAVALVFLGGICCPATPAHAGTCSVPGTHPTIQEAIDDPSCSTIDLQAVIYDESIQISRSVSIDGPSGGGAVIEGLTSLSGDSTVVSFSNLTVQNGCLPDGVRVEDGAELSGTNFAAFSDQALPCPAGSTAVFEDGFEIGDTSVWSVTVP